MTVLAVPFCLRLFPAQPRTNSCFVRVIQAHYSVKIAGPENGVLEWMSSSVRNQSKKWGSNTAMVTQRLAALRSHGSRFWGFGEAIKPPLFASFREHLPSTDLSQRKA